jgi:hypothetical protein
LQHNGDRRISPGDRDQARLSRRPFHSAESDEVSQCALQADIYSFLVLLWLQKWGRRYCQQISRPTFANDREAGRRLKIGYVSPDFRSEKQDSAVSHKSPLPR